MREALKHDNADVRYGASKLIDHFFIPQTLGDVIALTNDPDPRVRAHAFHALSCDECKADGCIPDEAKAIASALEAVRQDPDPFVRDGCRCFGQERQSQRAGGRSAAGRHATDTSPAVRKKARMVVPGGAIYERRAKEIARRQRREKTVA